MSAAAPMPRIRRRPPGGGEPALRAAGLDPLLARLLAARGVSAPEDCLYALDALPAPDLLLGAKAAAERLARAIDGRERVVVVADYDADGATACAVAVLGLRALGADVGYIVPNRFEYGYGLTPEIVALAARREPRVLITVDNGIASVDGVAAAAARGIDVVITDHHLPGAQLPAAVAIVDPNQPGCPFPAKHLAGVGVMFYVLLALRAALRARGAFASRAQPALAELLDLVALGTVADVVRLDRVNRILVHHGLARIRAGRARPGIVALFEAAGRDPRRATTEDLAFVLGPRLNAAGRLSDMGLGIECLLAPDPGRAGTLAGELDRLNRERRELEAGMQAEAAATIAPDGWERRASVCLFDPGWHQGVAGIVAGRIRERVHRPTIVLARAGSGELRGSGRSIPGFHLRDALDLVAKREPALIQRFGGHAAAAGLTLRETDWERFARAFEAVAAESLDAASLERVIDTDGPLPPEVLDYATARALAEAVWGQGFPPPLFDDRFRVAAQRTVGSGHQRLRLELDGRAVDAIAFRQAQPLPARIHAVYRVSPSEYQGLGRVELVLEHWAEAT